MNWWYMVSARCDVVAQNFYSYSDDEIFQSVVSTFAFVLTDPLNDVERETVEVSAEPITSSSVEMMSLERNMQVLPKAEEGSSSWAVHWSAHTNAVVLQNKRADKMRVSRGLSTDNRAYLIEAWCPDHPTALKVIYFIVKENSLPSHFI